MTTETGDIRNPSLLDTGRARLLVVDVQEKLVPAIHDSDAIVRSCADLLEAANLLRVPVFATEQYPRGLGSTVGSLGKSLPNCVEKVRFSAASVLDWSLQQGTQRDQVIVVGLETHVCVMQTVMDLLSQSFSVHIPVDAVGSRFAVDHDTALQRMRDHGATITTTETVIFELCETAAAPQFKQISQLVRERSRRLAGR